MIRLFKFARDVLVLLILIQLGCVPKDRSVPAARGSLVWRFLDPALACDEAGNVYVGSAERFQNHTQIFLATSRRYGESWETQFRYLNDSLAGERGRLQLSTGADGEIYALWEDTRNGSIDLYFNRSLDAGVTWLPNNLRLNAQSRRTDNVMAPRLVSDKHGNVAVVWLEDRDGFLAFYSNRSRNHGENWLPSDVRITSVSLEEKSIPRLVLDDSGALYLAWLELQSGRPVVFFNSSQDHGETWMIQSTQLSIPSAAITNIDLPALCALESGTVLVTWLEIRGGSAEILLTRSNDRGRTWQANPQPLRSAAVNLFDPSAPQILCDRNDNVYISWQVRSADRGDLLVLKSSEEAGRSFKETIIPRGNAPPGIPEARLRVGDTLAPFRMAADRTGNIYFTWVESNTRAARVGFDRISNFGQTWLGLGLAVDLAGHPPATAQAPLLCADDFGHVYLLWNEGHTLTVAASPFFGDSGWRYEHF